MTPFFLALVLFVLFLKMMRQFHQPFRGVFATVKQHVFHPFQQIRINLLIHDNLTGIDDAHIHTGLNGMIQEGRMHGLTNRIVAAQGKRQIAHPSADLYQGKLAFNTTRGLDIIHGIIFMFVHAGGHGKNVGVKNDVFRRKTHFIRQNLIGATANIHAALHRIGLPLLVKRHHQYGGAKTQSGACLGDKTFFPFF